MGRLRRGWPLLAVGAVVVLTLAVASSGSPRTPEGRTAHLASRLRCPVCQGVPIAKSPAPIARDMVAEVRRRVAAGESDEQILRYFADRYSDEVLLEPPGPWSAFTVYGLPLLLVGGGGLGIVLALRRGRSSGPPATPTEDERRLVDEALGRSRPEVDG